MQCSRQSAAAYLVILVLTLFCARLLWRPSESAPPQREFATVLWKQKEQVDHDDDSSLKQQQSQQSLLPHWNYCNATHVQVANDKSPVAISYTCQGPNYNDFAQQLTTFVEGQQQQQQQPPSWGHRRFPLPANRSILILGNSHARQQGWALACQMKYISEIHYFGGEEDADNQHQAVRMSFPNGASLYIVSNSYVIYSRQWQELLERQVQKPLHEFDAVVLGMFNDLIGAGKSAYRQRLVEQTKSLPQKYVLDFFMDPPGPGPLNITQVYQGPLLFVSEFATTHLDLFDVYCQQVRDLGLTNNNENNSATRQCLNARVYIDAMGEEGASSNRDHVQDLYADNHRAQTFHRCMGHQGGFPDLTAWDMSEFLYNYVRQQHSW